MAQRNRRKWWLYAGGVNGDIHRHVLRWYTTLGHSEARRQNSKNAIKGKN